MVGTTPGRRGPTRREEERESRREREREKDKEPAWMDDYVPEPGAPKLGIFGGKVEGMDDEIQAWKKKQAGSKGTSSQSTAVPPTEPATPSDSLLRDSAIVATPAPAQAPSAINEEQTNAFFFGLMKSEGSKSLSHSTTPAKTPEPIGWDAKSCKSLMTFYHS